MPKIKPTKNSTLNTLFSTKEKFEEEKRLRKEVSEGVNLLLEFIKKNPGKRVPHFEKTLNIPAKTIERWLTKLRAEGKIEFRGSPKTGGYWEVVEE